MFSWNNSIRKKLLIAMSSFCLIIMAQLVVSYFVIDRINEVNTLKGKIDEINSMWYEIRNNSLNYFNQETRNTDYFETGRSEYLWKVKRLDQQVKNELAVLMNDEHIKNMDIRKYAESARMTFYKYQTYFHDIEVRQFAKGYLDFGLEGQMRSGIKQLEELGSVPAEQLLTIKRNEKNFLLRGDNKYAEDAISLSNELINSLKANSSNRFAVEIQLLNNYISAFNSYVEHTTAIGNNNKSGLRNALNREAILLDRDLLKLNVKFNKQYQQQMKILVGIIILTAVIIVLLTLLLSYLVSNNLSRPIVKLAEKLKASSSQSGELENYQLPKNAPHEAVLLDRAFNSMLLQINNQVDEINGINAELKTQNEELTQLNQELDRFIYHTSHDLRSPLTSVSGLIEIIESSKEEDVQEYLNHMKFCIEQLDHTIVEIIHFYKNRSSEVKFSRIELGPFATVIYDQNKFHPLAKEIEFSIEMEDSFSVNSDSYRLNIILSNLIANSIKYRDAKKEHSRIVIKGYEQGSNWVIEVEDNGIGIAKKHVDRIFEMFYRASDHSTGSGIGLYIVTESIKKIGGEISVSSSEGVGSVFRIILPMVKVKLEEELLESKLV